MLTEAPLNISIVLQSIKLLLMKSFGITIVQTDMQAMNLVRAVWKLVNALLKIASADMTTATSS